VRRAAKVVIGVGVLAVVGGGAALAFGPGLYADWANRAAAEAPALEAAGGPLPDDVAALDGTWTVGEGSFAGYRVHEVLRGEDVTVTGRTEEVTGTVTVADGAVTEAEVVVDIASVRTDEPPRDAYVRGTIMEVGTYPTATFTLTEPAALPEGDAVVELVGDLTVRDVTREVAVEAQVGATDAGVHVVGSVPLTFSDFGVEAPQLPFTRVDGEGSVEFSLRLEREG
jgi:polyisoprenoid-binding protein YceI